MTLPTMPIRFATPLLVFVAVLAAACGGDSSPTATPSSTTAAQSIATTRPSETAVPAPTATPEPPAATTTPEPAAVPSPTPAPAAPVSIQPTAVPPPPAVIQPTPVPPPAAPPPAVSFNVTAQLLKFSTSQLSARSGASVTVNFRNEDASVAHDISFSIAGLGHGNTCVGPCTDRYTFVAPAPGTYDFFCTVHMEMTGKFVVGP